MNSDKNTPSNLEEKMLMDTREIMKKVSKYIKGEGEKVIQIKTENVATKKRKRTSDKTIEEPQIKKVCQPGSIAVKKPTTFSDVLKSVKRLFQVKKRKANYSNDRNAKKRKLDFIKLTSLLRLHAKKGLSSADCLK